MPPPPPGAGQGPSEEEVRAYLAQMRGAPAEQVIAEVLQGLINAAQVKLGRRDARLLLDTTAVVMDHARSFVDPELGAQVDQALTQLRLAQVEAEKEVAAAGQPEPNDLPAPPPPPGSDQPSPGSEPPPASAPPRGESPINKLWLPGR
jgi:hypothetical protein